MKKTNEQKVTPHQARNIYELIDSPVNVPDSLGLLNDFTFGYIEGLQRYAFAFEYGTQNSYFSNANAVEVGKCEKIEVPMPMAEVIKRHGHNLPDPLMAGETDCYVVYVMEESILSLIIWDSGTSFEHCTGKRIVINSEQQTISQTYLDIEELAPYCYSNFSFK